MIGKLKHDYDNSRKMRILTGIFAKDYETKKPLSSGICFQDVYLDNNWIQAPKSP